MSSASRTPRFWLIAIPLIAILLLIGGVACLYFRPESVEARLRRSITQALEDRFRRKVELESLQIKVFPQLQVIGQNLSLHGRTEVPTLLDIETFSFSGGLSSLFRPVMHIPLLRVQNLQISIPPRDQSGKKPLTLTSAIAAQPSSRSSPRMARARCCRSALPARAKILSSVSVFP